MHYLRDTFTTAILLILGTVPASALQLQGDQVTAHVVSDVTAAKQGQTFTLGVLFEMKPEWHIYWHNPGDSGLATSVNFELPEGMEAGPILWPAPTRFMQPGDILGYGYEHSVLLAAKVIVSGDLTGVTNIPIRAKIRWLSCKDVCVPGKADLEWNLPVSDSPEPDNTALFKGWEKSLPIEAFAANVDASTAGELPLDGSHGEFTMTLKFKSAAERVKWFPYSDRSLRVSDAKVEVEGSRADIRFEVSLLKGHELSSNDLPVVVTYKESDGAQRAIRVAVPLKGRK